MKPSAFDADVLILGAGPAGATAAALLAGAGHRVRVLEKARFPRFHIGESLLPAGMLTLQRVGVDLAAEGFLRKDGAIFVNGDDAVTFHFGEGLRGAGEHAYQVDRGRFDALIVTRAREAGAEVLEEVKATGVDISPDGVAVQTREMLHTGRFVLDATGQDRLLGRLSGTLTSYESFGKAAAFCVLEGLKPERAAELESSGHIVIFATEEGWAWAIPLGDRRLSVGVVTRGPKIDKQELERVLAELPRLAAYAEGTTRSEVRFARNFSYRNTAPYGARYACIGDAACFLDPIFSSGVSLALEGAACAADLLGPALDTGDEDRVDLMAPMGAHMDQAYEVFARLIHRFYHSRITENLFLSATEGTPMRSGMVSLLAGDVWRDDNRVQEMLLRSRRHVVG
ncbi:MAG: NAD(P)/FAD-dependent oxidoreductase [Myxococcota bacterium]|jgi:hypothetical protein|nr:NAD(P)/FAD-dependent oxidoreductase [Myxococcota bacterium]